MITASLVPHMKKEDRAKIVAQAFKEDKGKVLSLRDRYDQMLKRYEMMDADNLKVNGKRDKNNNRR
jgi:hypothetical protein